MKLHATHRDRSMPPGRDLCGGRGPESRKTWQGLLGILVLALVTGCGNLTAGGLADAEVLVVGDSGENEAPQSEASMSPSVEVESEEGLSPQESAPAEPSGVSLDLGNPFQGTVHVQVQVYLLSSGDEPDLLISESGGVEVDLRGELPGSLGTVRVPEGLFAGIRAEFTQVRATVLAGLENGLILPEEIVEVDLAVPVVIELVEPISVSEGGRIEVTVDIRSRGWLGLGQGIPRIVPANAFRNAVRVHVQVD